MSHDLSHGSSYDVIVIGAGPIGAASAWQLAERGLRVGLVDPRPGSGAAAAAAGMLAPVTEAAPGEEELNAAGLAAVARYPGFVAALEERAGCEVGYRTEGTLTVALDAADRAELSRSQELYARLGLAAEVLTSRACRGMEPLLSPAVTGGLFVAGDHQVDPRRLTAALVRAAQHAGVELVRQRARAVSGRSHVDGVVLDDGTRLASGTVVLAAGCWSGQVTGPDGAPLAGLAAVRPVKGQVLRLRVAPGEGPFLEHTVRGRVHGWPVYLVPRADGTVVVGATQEERGYDEAVTAGGVYQLLRDACELVPGVAELTWVEARAGLRPGSPDNAPLVGAAAPPGPTGLVLATGHHRNGVLLTPVTADAVVSLVVDGAVGGPLRAFAPSRFAAAAGAPAVAAGAPAAPAARIGREVR